jgi:hypothetical protein
VTELSLWTWDELLIRAVQAGVRLREIEDLTLFEVLVELTGYIRRVDDYRRIAAWHLSPVLSWLDGREISPAKLLGEEPMRVNIVGSGV